MTWILGGTPPFGYAALISDVRVSWGTDSYADVLQKIHHVGPWMMAGFAGSVQLGFAAIEDMRRFLRTDSPNIAWRSEEAAWRWRRRARRAFAKAPLNVQELGCSILLVGVSPTGGGGPFGPLAKCVRMRSPEFFPERPSFPFAWLSIGSGSTHDLARSFAEQTLSSAFPYLQGEVMNPGGTAVHVAMMVGMELMNTPLVGVSPQLQVGTVRMLKAETRTLLGRRDGLLERSWTTTGSTGLCKNWWEFRQFAQGVGRQATAAAT